MSKEFFKSDELRKDQEFKEFKAEEYRPRDINKTAAENYKTSEFSDHSTNKVKKEKNIIQKLIQKVTESASSYAGSLAVTATVLVTTVVVMTGLITSAPKIEILELDSNIDEVSYNILLEDLDENTDYKVIKKDFMTSLAGKKAVTLLLDTDNDIAVNQEVSVS